MHNTKWLMVVGLLLCGCGEPATTGEPLVPVAGTVTLDGEPLPTGRILFIDEDRQPRREYLAVIEQGAFEIEAPPGRRQVEIRSYDRPETPSLDDDPYPQILPARYNTASELTVELKLGEPKTVTFELASDGK